MTKTTAFDVAEHLTSPELVVAYLDEAFATGDPTIMTDALGAAARAHGMTEVAKSAGLSRESLYKALSSAQGAILSLPPLCAC